MRLMIVGLIMLALVAGGGTVFLVKRLLTQADEDARTALKVAIEKEMATTYVLVADKDVGAGASLTNSILRWQPWPQDAVEKSFTVSVEKDAEAAEQFIGAVARRAISEGTPITETMVFRRTLQGFMAGALEPGMRAMGVEVTPASAAAGFILPGDRVDVILTHDLRKDTPSRLLPGDTPIINDSVVRYSADTIVRDVRVLAIDQSVNDLEDAAMVVKTVTLEVTPKQAEMLALAVVMGDVSLSLRSLAEDTIAETALSFTTDVEVSPTIWSTFSGIAAAEEEAARTAEEAARAARRAGETTQPGSQMPVSGTAMITAPDLPMPTLDAPDLPSVPPPIPLASLPKASMTAGTDDTLGESAGRVVKVYRGGQMSAQEFPSK